jgi:hypothetical protein
MAYKRGNTIQQKWDRDAVCKIFEDCYAQVCTDAKIILLKEIYLYAHDTHKVSVSTIQNWISNLYKQDEEIQNLIELIKIKLESRVVKSNILTNQVQVLVLKNRHEYADKKEIDNNMNINGAKIVLEFPKEFKQKDKDGEAGQQESGHSEDKA